MIVALAAITLLITPATKPDVALRCTDPGAKVNYRVAAQRMDGHSLFDLASKSEPGTIINLPDERLPSWVFVRRAEAVCVEVPDHFSHYSPWFGARHTRRDRMP